METVIVGLARSGKTTIFNALTGQAAPTGDVGRRKATAIPVRGEGAGRPPGPGSRPCTARRSSRTRPCFSRTCPWSTTMREESPREPRRRPQGGCGGHRHSRLPERLGAGRRSAAPRRCASSARSSIPSFSGTTRSPRRGWRGWTRKPSGTAGNTTSSSRSWSGSAREAAGSAFFSAEDLKLFAGFGFLTSKPLFVIVNLGEKSVPHEDLLQEAAAEGMRRLSDPRGHGDGDRPASRPRTRRSSSRTWASRSRRRTGSCGTSMRRSTSSAFSPSVKTSARPGASGKGPRRSGPPARFTPTWQRASSAPRWRNWQDVLDSGDFSGAKKAGQAPPGGQGVRREGRRRPSHPVQRVTTGNVRHGYSSEIELLVHPGRPIEPAGGQVKGHARPDGWQELCRHAGKADLQCRRRSIHRDRSEHPRGRTLTPQQAGSPVRQRPRPQLQGEIIRRARRARPEHIEEIRDILREAFGNAQP